MSGPNVTFPDIPPTVALCGWSGSGKTWILERLLPRLASHGLKVLVVKHGAHGLDLDRPGTDSDRMFQAGAPALIAHDPKQLFLHARVSESPDSPSPLPSFAASFDLVLLEGHKHAPFPKVRTLDPGIGSLLEICPVSLHCSTAFE